MPGFRPLFISAFLTTLLISSGCAQGEGSPIAPSVLSTPAAPIAPLTVQVDRICAGRESNVKVLIDFVQIGETNPGEPGVSLMVTVGDHQLSAVSQRGTLWGPFPAVVPAGGSIERLGCMPADTI
jgi:hypothetical protein